MAQLMAYFILGILFRRKIILLNTSIAKINNYFQSVCSARHTRFVMTYSISFTGFHISLKSGINHFKLALMATL